jgi:ribosomal protein S18 acetylase RimI-like enzyme
LTADQERPGLAEAATRELRERADSGLCGRLILLSRSPSAPVVSGAVAGKIDLMVRQPDNEPTRRQPGARAFEVRLASSADVAAVQAIDAAAFPISNPSAHPALPEELEDAIEQRDVYVLDHDCEVAAFIHLDRRRPAEIYVAGLAVHPVHQGRGLGSELVEHALRLAQSAGHEARLVTVTSPTNFTMLRMLFARNFVSVRLLHDHFGPGKHRFELRLRPLFARCSSGSIFISVDDLTSVVRMLASDYGVIAVTDRDDGRYFVLAPSAIGESP